MCSDWNRRAKCLECEGDEVIAQTWREDPANEAAVRKFGLEWTIEDWPIKSLDMEASWHNQARISCPKHPDWIEKYKLAFERGDVFPMIFVLVTPAHSTKPLIAAGNHRTGGADAAGLKSVKAYTIRTEDDYVIDQLPRVLNYAEGLAISPAEMLEQAVDCVRRYKRELKQVADIYGVSYFNLRDKVLARTVGDRLQEVGVNADRINDTVRKKINVLSDNDNVMRSAAKFIIDTRATTEEAATFIDRLREHRTEASRLAFVEDQRRLQLVPQPAPSSSTVNGMTPPVKNKQSSHQRFLAWLTAGENLLKQRDTLEKNEVTKHDEREEVCQRLAALAAKLARMANQGAAGSKKSAGKRKAS